MKKLLFPLFLLVGISSLFAQDLSKTEAIDIARQLYKLEMLSEKGRDLLINNIEQNKFIGYLPSSYDTPQEVRIKKRVILMFLAQAFASDSDYRGGTTIYEAFAKEHNLTNPFEELQTRTDLSPEELQAEYERIAKEQEEQYEKLTPLLEAKMKEFEGFQIEEMIVDEDSLLTDSMGYTSYGMAVGLGINKLIHNKRSVFGKTCRRTANDLLATNLIDSLIHKDIHEALSKKEIFIEQMVIQFADMRAHYYNSYKGKKVAQLQQLDKLEQAKLISAADKAKIIHSYEPWKLKDPFEYLNYCKQAKTFDLRNYPQKPEKAFPLLFEAIKEIVPNFNYKNLKIKLLEKKDGYEDLIEESISISFQIDGRTYSQTNYYNLRRKNPTAEDIKRDQFAKVPDEIQNIVNKVLTDRNSPNRLYFFRKQGKVIMHSETEFGLMLMTEEESKAWEMYFYSLVYTEEHSNTFNSQNVEKIIQDLEKWGIFKHLSAKEIKKSKREIRLKSIERYGDILLSFPKVIVFFDWETGNLENPYEELTLAFGEISRGAFSPKDIVDNFKKDWKKETTLFSFKFNGKKYEKALLMNSDWLDPDFMDLIDDALKEHDIDGEIYPCINDGQAGGHIFLSKEQYKKVMEKYPKLLDDEY